MWVVPGSAQLLNVGENMDVLSLSRLQFAVTSMFHFIFVHLAIAYLIWLYRIFSGRITAADVINNKEAY